jgi:hypothetical protein
MATPDATTGHHPVSTPGSTTPFVEQRRDEALAQDDGVLGDARVDCGHPDRVGRFRLAR